MTKQFFIMTATEMNIMDIIWACNQPKTVHQLTTDIFAHHGKQMKPSTANTLCARLIKKGFVTYIQISGRNYYLPLIRKVEYQFAVTKLLVEKLFNGSTVALVSTLLMDCDLSQETLSELKTIVVSAPIPVDECTEECTQELEKPKAEQPKQQVSTPALPQALKSFYNECVKKKRHNKAHRPRAA